MFYTLYLNPVTAGFPSPADDFVDVRLDLNDYLIKNPASTFFVRCSGDSMIDAGIRTGDILIVDKSLEAHDGSIVIAVIDGELMVKRLKMRNNRLYLRSENGSFQDIEMEELVIWGVVTCVIHKIK